MFAAHQQTRHLLRFDWALQGADAIALDADVAVVIDVLSFTTTLTVALDGGTTVLPYRWNDSNAANFARKHNAVLAGTALPKVPARVRLQSLRAGPV